MSLEQAVNENVAVAATGRMKESMPPAHGDRRRKCLHEAAHAVIWALDPHCVIYAVEVSASGYGVTLGAYCAIGELNRGPGNFIRRENRGYETDNRNFTQVIKLAGRCVAEQAQAQLRRIIQGMMAGTLAEGISCGLSLPEICKGTHDAAGGDDIAAAIMRCLLLPLRKVNGVRTTEYDGLMLQTYVLLQQSAIWRRVMSLSYLLEQCGTVKGKDLQRFLHSSVVAE
jgi:hypothetical protein